MNPLIAIIFLLLTFCCSASKVPLQDTAIYGNAPNIRQKRFLAAYGRDDSSAALIKFYFNRRNMAKNYFFTGSALAVVSGVALNAVKNMPDDNTAAGYHVLSGKSAFTILPIPVFSSGLALLLMGLPVWIRYSRGRLLRLLNGYFAGKCIPRGIAKNHMFRGLVQYGYWNAAIKKQMKSSAHSHNKSSAQGRRSRTIQCRANIFYLRTTVDNYFLCLPLCITGE